MGQIGLFRGYVGGNYYIISNTRPNRSDEAEINESE
jgi:hypothetical protein